MEDDRAGRTDGRPAGVRRRKSTDNGAPINASGVISSGAAFEFAFVVTNERGDRASGAINLGRNLASRSLGVRRAGQPVRRAAGSARADHDDISFAGRGRSIDIGR